MFVSISHKVLDHFARVSGFTSNWTVFKKTLRFTDWKTVMTIRTGAGSVSEDDQLFYSKIFHNETLPLQHIIM